MSDSAAGAEKLEEAVVESAKAETAATEGLTATDAQEENTVVKTVPVETALVQDATEESLERKIPPAEESIANAASEEVKEEHPVIVGSEAARIPAEAFAEAPTAATAKVPDESPDQEASTSGAVLTAESPKTETTSPSTPRKPQKAAFNIDAKPFSPVSLSDPALQATLVGKANGLSIKIGQWSPQPFVPIAHLSPTAPVNVGHIPYVSPALPPAPAVKKETATGKDSLSAYAKPWSPHPEVTVTPVVAGENEVAIHPGSWSATTVDGKEVITPSPMVPRKSSTNLFAHSFSIHPKGLKSVELELFNYACARCTLRTLYGRLSSRQPDVTMRNVSVDVPPLCIAHLIEQITKAKVTALHLNESEGPHYDIWLDKPNLSTQLVEFISGSLWATPMHHGYAVMGKNEEGKRYLRNYVERLRDSKPPGPNVYDVALVEVKEH
ncbi:hypothetical protein LdCL_170013300 [Leishmania donovani]|uniref:Uncharacterized protein n=1 Tax=Leishmania donovani TaxID=5661 RepID=A0A3S7WUF4_LEIDO|nr:hypothetical protein LdCL_170013300 [Leishmania donovani]